jgi:hypothetical protein
LDLTDRYAEIDALGRNRKIDVRISIEPLTTNDGRAVVRGRTNLPDEIEVLITLSGGGQSTAVVWGGLFQSEPLGDPSTGVSAGRHSLDISTATATVIGGRAGVAIGPMGENLSGRHVSDGGPVWGKRVRFSSDYNHVLPKPESKGAAPSAASSQLSGTDLYLFVRGELARVDELAADSNRQEALALAKAASRFGVSPVDALVAYSRIENQRVGLSVSDHDLEVAASEHLHSIGFSDESGSWVLE